MLAELFPQMTKNSMIQIREDQAGYTHLLKNNKQTNKQVFEHSGTAKVPKLRENLNRNSGKEAYYI